MSGAGERPGEGAGYGSGGGTGHGTAYRAGGVLVPGGISVFVFALAYALGPDGGNPGGVALAGELGAVVGLLLASVLGAFGPDLGMAGSHLSRVLGRRGSYGSLWAERYGHDGGPTHGILAALVGTALVGGPATIVAGTAGAAPVCAAFAAAFAGHLIVDALSGRHPIRLLWPLPAERERGLGEKVGRGLGRAGTGAISSAEGKMRAWLKPAAREGRAVNAHAATAVAGNPGRTPGRSSRRTSETSPGRPGRGKDGRDRRPKKARGSAAGRGRNTDRDTARVNEQERVRGERERRKRRSVAEGKAEGDADRATGEVVDKPETGPRRGPERGPDSGPEEAGG